MALNLAVVLLLVAVTQGDIHIAEPTFTVTSPTCDDLEYYPGVAQEITVSIVITNDGSEQLPASDNNLEVSFWTYPLPDGVTGLAGQQDQYMQLTGSTFTLAAGSLSVAIPAGASSTVTGSTSISMPSDNCATFEQLCVGLGLSDAALGAGAGMGGNGTDSMTGACLDWGCTAGQMVGELDCDGPEDAATSITMTSVTMLFSLCCTLISLV
ncbi:uncharacterized protein LOC100378812 [Saccoglossus kowalevskii]|uniref:Uncharacterized protein LOC100378812 n=1 Tax=Saccoglossus kowalevskii TaxID=10224 RepID=A0ABM0GN87_SACKO|nr:PREDICTED: uncharacterized protein LOC100378812 [Saccoglossus kowalevskii]